ncbi:MAG: xanthine dehydrogenase family protein molybdopterin-binding subunit [Stappiaceae bacterium]
MTQSATPKFGIGASVRRKEDAAFVTGKGRYLDDIQPINSLFGFIVRSPMAHARFTINNTDEVRSLPGVALLLTAADIADLGDMPTQLVLDQIDGSKHKVPPRPVLERDTVRHMGDSIAFIVAETVAIAKDAAEHLDIDFDPLESVIGIENAIKDGAVLVWPDYGSNIAFHSSMGNPDTTDAAFRQAARTVEIDVVNNRLVANYMETRGCIAEYDEQSERFTITLGTQGGHGLRKVLCNSILKIDPARMRVVTPDVGGGFGTKIWAYREYPLCCIAAQTLGRPVKWTADRMDHFIGDTQGRDNLTKAAFALDDQGKILGLRIRLYSDMGSHLHQFAPGIPWIGASMATGLYDIKNLYIDVIGVYTHTVPTDAYRGAGRPEAAYVLERLADKAARDLGMTPAEFRRLNFIAQDALPYKTPTGRLYDTGDYSGHLDRALVKSDWEGFGVRAEASHARGKYRGIGMATYIEACAFSGSEEANLQLDESGKVTLLVGTQTNGQGHATAYSQLLAEHLGLELEQITVIQGDTDLVPNGGGTGGSRSIPIALPSIDVAGKKLAQQLKQLAAHQLEAGIEDLELANGTVRIVGTDRQLTLSEIAKSASDKELLKAYGKVQQDENTYPNGTHICELEVDPETGVTEIMRYTIVDDFGVTLNPLLLEGQVHGGVAQALGQALHEQTVYDENGQLLTASFLDYTMPRAADLLPFDFETRNVPSTTNAMGLKGAGEAGTIGAAPAAMNALENALRSGAGVDHIDMPATPQRVWQAIQDATG